MFKGLKNISANYIMMLVVVVISALVLFSGLKMQKGLTEKAKDTGYKPMRIVSMSVSADEMLLALVGDKRLIAVSPWSEVASVSCIADKVKAIPHRAYSSNAEALLAIQGDLIVVPDYTRTEVVRTLREAGAKVYVCNTPRTLQEVRDTLQQLGELVGETAKARQIVAQMDARLQRIASQVAKIPDDKRVKVLRLQENGSYYAPKSSFMEICRLAGMQDASEELHYDYSCTLSQEEILLLNPDVFVLEDWNYDGRHDSNELKQQILSNRAYEGTKAWQQQRVVLIPANHLLTVSQYMVEAVEDMAMAVYPEYVKR